jgi:hypothetical protein
MAEHALQLPDAGDATADVPAGRRDRRPVTLAACASREDGSLIEMTVTNLSYDGCKVSTAAALTAGERLCLSVPRRGAVPATVRWCVNGKAGLAFDADEVEETRIRHPRRHQRVSIEGEVSMRRSGKLNFHVHVYDLSPEGCKAEFVERPLINEKLWIKFDGLEALEGEVRWITGSKAGVQFTRPFYAAVFDMLIARLN